MRKFLATVTCAVMVASSLSVVADSSKLGLFGTDTVSAASTVTKPKADPKPKADTNTKTPGNTVSMKIASKFTRLVKKGHVGGDVKFLQTLLNNNGAKLKVDGIYGPKTLTAVKSYQKSKGLKADGLVGPKTQAAITTVTTTAPVTVSKKYNDGTYEIFNAAYNKGASRTVVEIKNDKIAAVTIQRVGVNFADRGSGAYKPLAYNIPIWQQQFLAAGTLENAMKVDIYSKSKVDAAGNAVADAVSGPTSSHSGEGFKEAIEIAFEKAAINKTVNFKYFDGEYAALDAAKTMYTIVTVEDNAPVKLEIFFLNASGAIIADAALTAEQKAILAELLKAENVIRLFNGGTPTVSEAAKSTLDILAENVKTALSYASGK